MYKLFVNDIELDLEYSESRKIRITYIANDVFTPEKIQGDYSTSFQIPATPKNCSTFGFANDLQVYTNFPYIFQACRIESNGLELEPDLLLYLNSFKITKSGQFFEARIFSGNVNFFDKIRGLTVADLPDTPPFSYDLGSVDNVGFVQSPVVYNGKPGSENNVDLVDICRAVSLDLLLEQIFALAGLPYNQPTPFLQEMFAVGDLKIALGKSYRTWRNERCSYTGATLLIPGAIPSGFLDISTYSSIVAITYQYSVLQRIVPAPLLPLGTYFYCETDKASKVRFKVEGNWSGDFTLGIVSLDGATVFAQQTQNGLNGFSIFDLAGEIPANVGYQLQIISSTLGASFNNIKGVMLVYPTLQYKEILGQDILLTDIFKEIAIRFQWVIQYDPYSKKLDISEANAIDIRQSVFWSDKLDVLKQVEVKYSLEGYAQKNFLTHDNTKDNTEGDFTFTLFDQKAALGKDIYKSIFSYPRVIGGHVNTAQFEIKQEATTKEISALVHTDFNEKDIKNYLIFASNDNRKTLQVSENYSDSGTDAAGVNFSESVTLSQNIAFLQNWEYFYENYFKLTKAVGADNTGTVYPRVLTCYANLSLLDILNLDFMRPVVIQTNFKNVRIDAAFYLNKISQWYDGAESVKIELIELVGGEINDASRLCDIENICTVQNICELI